MKKWIVAVLLLGMLTVTGAWAQDGVQNPDGVTWDANTEPDLAGYLLYEAETSDGQVTDSGTFWSIAAPETMYTFPPGHAEGTFYWKVTAVDTSGNQSGFSNEAWAYFDYAPAPPTGCVPFKD